MNKYRKSCIIIIIFCFISLMNINVYAASSGKSPAKTYFTTVKFVSKSSVQLNWKKAKNAQKYEVYISVNGSKFRKKKITKATKCTITGLKPGFTYTYRVRSVNGFKKSSFSTSKKVNTLSTKSPKLTATASGTIITLKWNPVDNASGYYIYQKVGTNYVNIGRTSGNIYKVNNLELNTAYSYIVKPYMNSYGKIIIGTSSTASAITAGAGYLLDLVQPYRKPYWFTDYNKTNFKMGGISYTHGFTTMGYGDENVGNETYFNLEGKYTKMSFVSGITDDSGELRDAVVYIYKDGELVFTYDIEQNALPKKYLVDVTDCMQLKICVYDGRGTAMYSGTYGFGNVIIEK